MFEIIKPNPLCLGDTIGMYTPANRITLPENVVQAGYDKIRAKGFQIKESPVCRKVFGHTAGTPEERADALHELLIDSEVKAVMTFWGGYQSHQVLEHLDYELIARQAKPIIGYSDVTSLTLGIFAKTNLVGFSGPAGISFVKPTLCDYTWKYFHEVLVANNDSVVYSASEEFSDNLWFLHEEKKMIFEPTPAWKALQSGVCQGPLVVGNLGTMLLLHGTEFWPSMQDVILIVEEDEVEKPETIDRLFTQLRQIGVFDQIKGLVIGRIPRQVGFSEKDKLEDLVLYATRGYKFPILMNIDYGHTDPILTLPIGVKAELDADRAKITLLEKSTQIAG